MEREVENKKEREEESGEKIGVGREKYRREKRSEER